MLALIKSQAMKLPLSIRFRHSISSTWKYIVSYSRVNWSLSDYPIWLKEQGPTDKHSSNRTTTPRFVAQIINWPLVNGTGDTQEDALKELQKNFESIKARREVMPRPGSHVPLEFGSQVRINRYRELADEFVDQILDVEWALLADESSLWDFHGNDSNEVYLEKIKKKYHVDVSHVADGNIATILETITATR